MPSPDAPPVNFGWPCYEGTGRQPGYDSAGLALCDRLYASGNAVRPVFTYQHGLPAAANDTCSTTTGSSTSGVAFVANPNWPIKYQNGLIWADYARQCLYLMPAGPDGRPDPTRVEMFEQNSAYPVDLQVGPGKDLFYADVALGAIHRISYGQRDTNVGAVQDTWSSRPGTHLADIPPSAPPVATTLATRF